MEVPSPAPRQGARLVGNSLLYAISAFASLGVFLVGIIYSISTLFNAIILLTICFVVWI